MFNNIDPSLKKNYLFLAVLSLFCIMSTIFIVAIKWQLPLLSLFSLSDSLSAKDMINQLIIIAQTGVSLFAGGLLAVVSMLLQQVVRNNLASETTLAIGSGAQLSMLAVIVFFPNLALFGSFWVAFIGALITIALVIAISLPSKMNPIVLIMAGLVINILCTALGGLVMVFYANYVNTLIIWAMGYLAQDNWFTVSSLALLSIITLTISSLFHKPLTIMSLDDDQARQLGVPVKWVRIAVFVGCAIVTAFIVSRLGLISFIGLGAVTIVNVLRIYNIRIRLLVSFIIGGMLLLLTNNCIVIVEHYISLPKPIPAGALTGFLGAPIILWLIIKDRKKGLVDTATSNAHAPRKALNWSQFIIAFVIIAVMALFYVNSNTGWYFDSDLLTNLDLLQYRGVRTLTAGTTGIMLAVSGLLLQRMTQNPMASPEVLGISSASAIAMVLAFLVIPLASPLVIFASGVVGSCAIMLFLIWLMKYISANYLLLVGIAIGAIMNGFTMVIAFIGDPRLQAVLGWLSGSTYHANPSVAIVLLIIAIACLTITLLLAKPINLLSLNETVARSVGLSVRSMQIVLLILIAVMSTFATMAIGPLSFIGLMTPHLAMSMGATQFSKQLPLSALLGAMVMIVADWIGRYIMFPYEISAGTLASVIGCLYFLLLIRRVY